MFPSLVSVALGSRGRLGTKMGKGKGPTPAAIQSNLEHHLDHHLETCLLNYIIYIPHTVHKYMIWLPHTMYITSYYLQVYPLCTLSNVQVHCAMQVHCKYIAMQVHCAMYMCKHNVPVLA